MDSSQVRIELAIINHRLDLALKAFRAGDLDYIAFGIEVHTIQIMVAKLVDNLPA